VNNFVYNISGLSVLSVYLFIWGEW